MSIALVPGGVFRQVLINRGDSAPGQAMYSAGVPLGSAPASGRFLLASGHLRAKAAAIRGTEVTIRYNAIAPYEARSSIVADPSGNALAISSQSGMLRIGYHSFLPIVIRNHGVGW